MKALLVRVKVCMSPLILALIILVVLSLLALGPLGDTEKYILMIVAFVLGLFPGMNILQIIKKLFKVEDNVAQILVVIISAVLAIGILFAVRALAFADLTLDNFNAIFGLFFAAATIAYRAFMKKTPS